jgi:hypothetical protein
MTHPSSTLPESTAQESTLEVAALHVSAIDPARLDDIRAAGRDESGNSLAPFPAEGWEPLRCCLEPAPPGQSIVLIAYSPFTTRTAWTETGPVFVHAERCAGYEHPGTLPEALRTGPRVLRTYHADESLDYADITVIDDGRDIEAPLLDLLSRPQVAVVHVRALAAQCFTYSVTRAPDPGAAAPSA